MSEQSLGMPAAELAPFGCGQHRTHMTLHLIRDDEDTFDVDAPVRLKCGRICSQQFVSMTTGRYSIFPLAQPALAASRLSHVSFLSAPNVCVANSGCTFVMKLSTV